MQAEADRLIYEDPDEQLGFMLHPDMKWVCGMRLYFVRPRMRVLLAMRLSHSRMVVQASLDASTACSGASAGPEAHGVAVLHSPVHQVRAGSYHHAQHIQMHPEQ
jgi:hypothetical protein